MIPIPSWGRWLARDSLDTRELYPGQMDHEDARAFQFSDASRMQTRRSARILTGPGAAGLKAMRRLIVLLVMVALNFGSGCGSTSGNTGIGGNSGNGSGGTTGGQGGISAAPGGDGGTVAGAGGTSGSFGQAGGAGGACAACALSNVTACPADIATARHVSGVWCDLLLRRPAMALRQLRH